MKTTHAYHLTGWDRRFLSLARHISAWSKDPSSKVGCVLVNDRIVVGMGYNGFPRGVLDLDVRYNDRPTKYLYVQHAEANAVLNASGPVKGATAYVTHPPCANCTGMLIQSKVRRVIAAVPDATMAQRFEASFKASREMATEAGVELIHVEGI